SDSARRTRRGTPRDARRRLGPARGYRHAGDRQLHRPAAALHRDRPRQSAPPADRTGRRLPLRSEPRRLRCGHPGNRGRLRATGPLPTRFFEAAGPHLLMRTSPSRDARAAKLESAEARFRTLFEHAPIGVVIADSDSYYLDANPTACRMFGYSRDEFVGLHARDIVVDADTAAVRPALDEIHRDERHERQWRFRRRDGSTFAADVRATKLADGTLLGLISDVSDRVEVEQALRNEQTFSETMIDSMPGVL